VWAIAPGRGIYKSTDGGERWELLFFCCFDSLDETLALDPIRPTTAWAGFEDSLHKTIDGGRTWQRAGLDSMVHAIALDPSDPAVVYVGTEEGVFKSSDAGRSWQELQGPLDGVAVLALAIDSEYPQIVYASTNGFVFRSTDGGDHWRRLGRGLPVREFDALAVDPAAGILYAGSAGAGLFELSIAG
jgi:photosystem II stability/assembly factor-like uncharacterized protein